eukprot:9495436-Pyramimonas_sp.AAC.1
MRAAIAREWPARYCLTRLVPPPREAHKGARMASTFARERPAWSHVMNMLDVKLFSYDLAKARSCFTRLQNHALLSYVLRTPILKSARRLTSQVLDGVRHPRATTRACRLRPCLLQGVVGNRWVVINGCARIVIFEVGDGG